MWTEIIMTILKVILAYIIFFGYSSVKQVFLPIYVFNEQ